MMNETEFQKKEQDPDSVVSRYRVPNWNRDDLNQQKLFLEKLDERFRVSFEYIALNCLFIVILIIAFITDQLSLILLALLVAPIMIPIYGFAFGISLGSLELIKKGLIALFSIGSLTFLSGLFSGFIISQINMHESVLWDYFIHSSWANFVLIFIGLLFAITIILRNPKQNINIANVALAYGFYLPLAVSGFSVFGGDYSNVRNALNLFAVQFLFSVIIGTFILIFSGVRAKGSKVVISFISAIAFISLLVLLLVKSNEKPNIVSPEPTKSQIAQISTQQLPKLSPTNTLLPTRVQTKVVLSEINPTDTLVIPPTLTPTLTLTPLSTPIWAEIQAIESNGANIRAEPGYNGKIISTVLNGTLIQVLPEVEVVDNNTWVHIRLQDQTEGWIVRSLLISSTPAPDW
ncbi:MAG: DUF389 domain-containing protein [Anaerolineaceae bacterium]